MRCSHARRSEICRTGQLVEEKEAAAVKVNARLLEVRALSDPQVERAVRYEKGEDDVAAENDESQGKGPRQN